MRLPRVVERAASYVAIPNVTVALIAVQVLCLLLMLAEPGFGEKLLLVPEKVVHGGEWWRVVTFVFMPVSTDPIFSVFVFLFFYMMGTALEMNWGTVKYNVYLWLALVFSVGSAFVPWALGERGAAATNGFVYNSVFLAFAFLFPEYRIYIFFILPVKAKWLALISWIIVVGTVLIGGWMSKALAIASVGNFLLFFWHDLYLHVKEGRWKMQRQVKRMGASVARRGGERGALHKCVVCGATEVTQPQAEFRYCAECGGKCYCMTHLQGHVHTLG
jgi:hypothetical protein